MREDELQLKPADELAAPDRPTEQDDAPAAGEEQETMTPEEMEAVRSDIFVKLK